MTYGADDATRYAPAVDLGEWIEGYRRAWETADADLVLTLFTEDASYRANPFEEPHHGHDGIRAYWESVTSQQREPRVHMGRPFVNGDRVAVEWWTTMVSEGQEVTLPGCLLLRFEPGGRCSDLREYWNFTAGRREPFDGWGT
jgi:ketosteroid isomerase-like protein